MLPKPVREFVGAGSGLRQTAFAASFRNRLPDVDRLGECIGVRPSERFVRREAAAIVDDVDASAQRLAHVRQGRHVSTEQRALDALGEVEFVERIIGLAHAANFSFRATAFPMVSASFTGTALPSWRMVSDQEP